MIKVLLLSFVFVSCAHDYRKDYPAHWWKPIPKKELHWWEISPENVKHNEVVLSKRNELGILSNFADTPFELDGKRYATLEGLWQSMKYPENKKDPRYKLAKWPHKRSEVEQMQGFAAKKAGSFASKVMIENKIKYVTYKGEKLVYGSKDVSPHYLLIRRAMKAKLEQNPKVREILLKTKNLKLLPDHIVKGPIYPAWRYYDIWMEYRDEILKGKEAN